MLNFIQAMLVFAIQAEVTRFVERHRVE